MTGKTIAPALTQFERLHGYLPQEQVADRGYQGKSQVKGVKVSLPKPATKKLSACQKRKNRKKFRKRAGIELIISHLKHDFRLSRNFLSGKDGDRHNLMMAVTAFNFRKWIVNYQRRVKNWLASVLGFYHLYLNRNYQVINITTF